MKRFKRITSLLLCLVTVMASALTVSAGTGKYVYSESAPGAGVVTSDTSLRIRSESNTSSITLAYLASGSYIMLIGQENGFFKVKDNNGVIGFSSMDYISDISTPYFLFVTVDSGSTLNFRQSPSASSTRLHSIPNGTAFAYLSSPSSDWKCGVYLNDMGYVASEFVGTSTR